MYLNTLGLLYTFVNITIVQIYQQDKTLLGNFDKWFLNCLFRNKCVTHTHRITDGRPDGQTDPN